MFDRLSDRISTAVVTGLDVAVEFATLGEYRLAVAPEEHAAPAAPPRPARPARVFDGSSLFAPASEPVALPRPATAAVREPAPVPPVVAICASARTRGRAIEPKRSRPRPRARGGAVGASEQLCLWP